MSVNEKLKIKNSDEIVWMFPCREVQTRRFSFRIKFFDSNTKYYKFIDIKNIINIDELFIRRDFLEAYKDCKQFGDILDTENDVSQKARYELIEAFNKLEENLSDESKLFLECYE